MTAPGTSVTRAARTGFSPSRPAISRHRRRELRGDRRLDRRTDRRRAARWRRLVTGRRAHVMMSREAVAEQLAARGYVADDALAMSVFLALRMQRALFLEGAPGVGKTLLARVLAELFDTRLIRLQCYEGL